LGKGGKHGKGKPFTPADKARLQSSAALRPTPGKAKFARKVQSAVDKGEAGSAEK
jgi:hypothetical protein